MVLAGYGMFGGVGDSYNSDINPILNLFPEPSLLMYSISKSDVFNVQVNLPSPLIRFNAFFSSNVSTMNDVSSSQVYVVNQLYMMLHPMNTMCPLFNAVKLIPSGLQSNLNSGTYRSVTSIIFLNSVISDISNETII